MPEWGDVAWSAATPKYRKSQLILLVKELAAREELEDAVTELVQQAHDAAEELYDMVDDALTAADETNDNVADEEASDEH